MCFELQQLQYKLSIIRREKSKSTKNPSSPHSTHQKNATIHQQNHFTSTKTNARRIAYPHRHAHKTLLQSFDIHMTSIHHFLIWPTTLCYSHHKPASGLFQFSALLVSTLHGWWFRFSIGERASVCVCLLLLFPIHVFHVELCACSACTSSDPRSIHPNGQSCIVASASRYLVSLVTLVNSIPFFNQFAKQHVHFLNLAIKIGVQTSVASFIILVNWLSCSSVLRHILYIRHTPPRATSTEPKPKPNIKTSPSFKRSFGLVNNNWVNNKKTKYHAEYSHQQRQSTRINDNGVKWSTPATMMTSKTMHIQCQNCRKKNATHTHTVRNCIKLVCAFFRTAFHIAAVTAAAGNWPLIQQSTAQSRNYLLECQHFVLCWLKFSSFHCLLVHHRGGPVVATAV